MNSQPQHLRPTTYADPLAIVVGPDGFFREIPGVPETFVTASGLICRECRIHRARGREVFLRHLSQRVSVGYTDGKDNLEAEKEMVVFKSVNGKRFILLGHPESVFRNPEQCAIAFVNWVSAGLEAAACAARAQREFFARPVMAGPITLR